MIGMDSDDFMIIMVFAIIIMIFLGIVVLLLGSHSEKQPLPLSCGITEENKSESHIVMMLIGKTWMPQTHYHHDLVCTNGTTIFEYQG